MKEAESRKREKLQPRIIRTVMVMIFVFSALIYGGISLYWRITNTNQAVRDQLSQINKTAEQVSFWQTTTINIAKKVAVDTDLREKMEMPKASTSEYALTKRGIRNTLRSYTHIENGIQEILFYTNDGRTFSSAEMRGDFVPEQNGWYVDFQNTERISGYTKVHSITKTEGMLEISAISYIMPYSEINDYQMREGYIIVIMEYAALEKIMSLDMTQLNGYCLYDRDGEPIVAEGEITAGYDEIIGGAENGIYQKKGQNTILISDGMEDGWHIVVELSDKAINRQITRMAGVFLVIMLGLVTAVGIILNISIHNIVKPVEKLTEAVEKLGTGNFDVAVEIHTNDELEVLADVFNRMVGDIRELLENAVEHEKMKRKMQIDNLMLRINPHFIYNTLNSIIYMASEKEDERIIRFTNAFISLLQNTLRIRNTIYVSLEEELENVKNYVEIQKYRYMDMFDLMIECPEECLHVAIPNIMLQPMVENAIFHGIAPKEEHCILKVLVERQDKEVMISIIDDGCGMPQEKADQLLQEEQENYGGMRKIGVANVNKRMKEIYGESHRLEIISEEGAGTRIVMRIPYGNYEE